MLNRAMKTAFLLSNLIAFGLLGLAPAAMAQTPGADDLSGDANSNEVFSGSDVNFYDLIHQAGRNSSGVSAADFSRQQQRRIPNAVEDFRQRQQEVLSGESATETDTAETLDIEL